MTQLVVARRDGVIKGPDGEMHRVVKGKTLADARHPAVMHTPQAWVPMAVALPVEGDEPAAGPGELANGEAAATALAELVDARAEAADYLAALATVVETLAELGYPVPAEGDRAPGWLADAVRRAVAGELPPAGDEDVIPPPRAARSRARARTES